MDFNFGSHPYITLNRKWGTFAKLEMQYLYQILGMNLWMPDRCVNGRNELSSNFELWVPSWVHVQLYIDMAMYVGGYSWNMGRDGGAGAGGCPLFNGIVFVICQL